MKNKRNKKAIRPEEIPDRMAFFYVSFYASCASRKSASSVSASAVKNWQLIQ